MFIAQRLVGPSKQLKQIIQIEDNIVKNPNWPEANQFAIYKRGQGFELGAAVKQIQVGVRAGLEPGTAGLQVRCADHLATLPVDVIYQTQDTVFHVIYQTRATVFYRDIQTPRRELKIRRAAEYF